VRERVRAGVQVHIGGYMRRFTRDIAGPVTVCLDETNQRIVCR